ncbi:MAG: tRNA preQ1(34) S-adenosylmethionine ribosyltransferase-isomerase QueA [Pseudomonadota bacterium]
MRTQDFDFYLPDSLIAQHPSSKRSASKLLYLRGHLNQLSDQQFTDLPDFLAAGDLLVFNDTRVIKARLFGVKTTGGQVEVLVERVVDENHVLAHVRASRAPKRGNILNLADAFEAKVIDREDDLFHLQFLGDESVLNLLERYGALPLPPYITHSANADDDERYQTIYAKHVGAVAAPTAGLHFDDAIMNALKAKGIGIAYVTLHVGAGTFQPVRVDEIKDHKMHSEIYQIPAETVTAIEATKLAGGNIVAVGTTSLRALESAALHGTLKPGSAETAIFITPGFHFKIVDKLLTNFHLPKSTLLMLVSAFAGFEPIKQAYAHAIEKQYRFFSYGDAMLIEKLDPSS